MSGGRFAAASRADEAYGTASPCDEVLVHKLGYWLFIFTYLTRLSMGSYNTLIDRTPSLALLS